MSFVVSKRGTTSHFLSYIKRRIERNKNFLGVITGPTGSGKSYSALRIAELLDPAFSIKSVCFTPKEFLERINSGELGKGSVLVWDEAGVTLSSRQWQSVSNKLINYLLQTFRHRNYIVLFTSPHLAFLDAGSRRLVHAYMETVGIDQENKRVKLKPLLLQVSQRTGDTYYKYLRVALPGRGIVPVKRFSASMPSKELCKAYEERKNQFTRDLNESIEAELEQVEQHKPQLTERQAELVKLFEAGMTIHDIAETLGIHEQSIRDQMKLIRKKGWVIKPVKVKGKNLVERYEVTNSKDSKGMR